MIDLTDKILKYGNNRKDRIIGRYSVSDLWGLLTINSYTGKPYTSIQEWLDGKKNTFDGCFKMWQGSWKHKQIQDLMKDCGYMIEVKKEYKLNNFMIVGMVDLMNEDTILEIKTSDELITTAKRWHIWQVKMYLSIFQRDKGIIFQPVIKPNKLLLKELGVVKRNDSWFDGEIIKIEKLHNQLLDEVKKKNKENNLNLCQP